MQQYYEALVEFLANEDTPQECYDRALQQAFKELSAMEQICITSTSRLDVFNVITN